MDIKQALQNFDLRLTEIKTRLPGQDEPAYYKPVTLAQSDRINAMIDADGAQGDGAKLALTIMECVLDKDGAKVFDLGDKGFLLNQVPQSVLLDIVNEISATPSIEDAEGN